MIYFYNDGEIDIRAVTTMGVSVKDSANPIGFFGTGLKYSIAVILRIGGKIIIHSGLNKYEFTSQKCDIRGKNFNIVQMNDVDLGFTTDLGKTWESWMVFRELYCNCKDENGEISFSKVSPEAGKTVIEVNCSQIEAEYNNRDKFLIGDRKLVAKARNVEIFQKINNENLLFYRGIRVNLSQKDTMFDYNVLSPMPLTEDRTVDSYTIEYRLRENISYHLKDKSVLKKILTAHPNSFEGSMNFSFCNLSDEFYDAVEELIDTPDYGKINKSVVKAYYKDRKKEENLKSEPITEYEQEMLDKCIKILKYQGYDVSKYRILTVSSLGDDILGQADLSQKLIYIAKDAFLKGQRTLLGTLYEEYVHLALNMEDETRRFQNHLIDSLAGMFERTYDKGI